MGGASNQGETSQTIPFTRHCPAEKKYLLKQTEKSRPPANWGITLQQRLMELMDNVHVVSVVLGHHVGSLQHQTNGRTILCRPKARIVPLVVSVSVNMSGARGCQMPRAEVLDRLGNCGVRWLIDDMLIGQKS